MDVLLMCSTALAITALVCGTYLRGRSMVRLKVGLIEISAPTARDVEQLARDPVIKELRE